MEIRRRRTGFGSRETPRKRFCRFCQDKQFSLDYKDVKRLEKFVSDRGKILSSRLTGNCAKHQRILAQAIKRARYLALLSYIGK